MPHDADGDGGLNMDDATGALRSPRVLFISRIVVAPPFLAHALTDGKGGSGTAPRSGAVPSRLEPGTTMSIPRHERMGP